MSDLTPSQKELLSELFIDPFMEGLFDEYKEKTLENKIAVEQLIEFCNYGNLYFDLISFIEPKVKPNINHPIINALQGLWKIYNRDVDLNLKSVFGQTYISDYSYRTFCNQQYNDAIKNYYGDDPQKGNPMSGEQFNNEVKKCINFIMDKNNSIVSNFISKRIQHLRKYMNLQYDTSKGVNLSYCDLSNMDFRMRLMTDWVVKNCDFTKSKFKGDGSTGTCIHWNAINCNFTDADFEGKICNKTSKYDGSNFTRVNLTTLSYNMGEISMKGCNFTDAYVIIDDEKLMGKKLLKYLAEKKHIDIAGSYYCSPQDNGYNPNELDPNIWIAI